MSAPWLTLIGLTEAGLAVLTPAARAALEAAEVVFGGPRHLALAEVGPDRARPWPVPFDAGPVLAARGRRVAVLASGDPFWHGAGGTLARLLPPEDWVSLPAPSTFALAANALGWRLEETACLGLHAAPLSRLRPHLAPGARLIVLLRDAAAAAELAAWLAGEGAGAAELWLLERLGGPRARIRRQGACDPLPGDLAAPLAAAVELPPDAGLPHAPGLPEDLFAHDGQITKGPVRALAISALAPRPGELLWDLGAGSGSVSVEWALAGGHAVAVEARADRAANVAENARRFGLDHRIAPRVADWRQELPALPPPQAVFAGGGLDAAALAALWAALPPGARLVAHAVTLETEALLAAAQAEHGGRLLRLALAEAAPLGRGRGWAPARPVVQWSVRR